MFRSGHCSCKGARPAEERKKKNKKAKMTKVDFHRFQVHHFSNVLEHFLCYCKLGQRQRVDLRVLNMYNSPPGEISVFER